MKTVFACAVGCIISALKKFPDRPDLQSAGISALETFSNDDEYDAAQLITKSGGLDVVFETMKAFPNNDTILESCCGLLYNLTCNEYIDMMEEAGVISLLATTMDQYKSNDDIQEFAHKALLQLLGGLKKQAKCSLSYSFAVEMKKSL
jgi:threonine dehydrogenase-like Zn-dependent dehydrogenase